MSGEPSGDATGPESAPAPEPEWVRRRRLAEVFGDVLPETTSDERDREQARSPRGDEDPGDTWLREQVPPHHGG